jgi:N-acetylglutamate synthase-like GNAT family acetyltransferase
MNSSSLRIRRATVEDLDALKSLWTSMRLPADELEGRLTEFQVAQSGGQIIGALGFQIIRQHALLHGEAYSDFSFADAARELFLERIESLASNHGVFRLWTQEHSPFWTHAGFLPPNSETLAHLPEEWKNSGGEWLTLQLKNEEVITTALENKFAGFMDAEKKQTVRVAEKARALKNIITVVCFAIGILGIGVAIYLLIHRNPFSQ